ncbi:MAG: helix-turn-helix domain-containing protein [Pseudonocardiaceae bacterium]
MTGDVAAAQAGLGTMRRRLGALLAAYRRAAGLSQPELGRAIGRTRSMVSKIENGARAMPRALWTIADGVCHAKGALLAEHHTLAQAEQDYRARCRAQRAQAQQRQAQAQLAALRAAPELGPMAGWPGMVGVDDELAGELMAVVMKLVRSVGRRNAMQVAGWTLATMGLSSLDTDECTRLAQAVDSPHRVDAHVIENLATTLAHCKRLEDTLGPGEVLDTVVAQHQIVRRLLGGCSGAMVKPLKLVESNMASTIGLYLIDMGHPEGATDYFQRARKAGHEAGSPTYAAYAAISTSYVAFLRHDTPAALDTAAAARSLAARTQDTRLKALAEQAAADAYALDGQHGPYLAACARAQEFLASANRGAPDSPAYWVHESTLGSRRSTSLALLGKPQQAVEAAADALGRFNRTYLVEYTRNQVRLGHALILCKEITEATRVLGDAASHVSLSPRITAELHTARALMQPWENTKAVQELDTHLHACGLMPTHQTKQA